MSLGELPRDIVVLVRNLRADVVGAEVIDRFARADIQCILMKGPALGRLLYSSRRERDYVDVDLLVAPRDYERAGRELERLGFVCSNAAPAIPLDRPVEGREWSRKDGAVDLHASLPETGLDPEEAWSYLWQRTQVEELRGVPVSLLDVPRRALLVGLHAAHHHGAVPKVIEDLRRAIDLLPKDVWVEAARSARHLECEDAFATGLRYLPEGRRLAHQLHLSEEAWSVGRLRSTEGQAESLGVALALERMSRLRGLRTRMAYLRNKLIPPRRYMREWLNLHPGRGGLAGAYVRRLITYCGHLLEGIRRWQRARSRKRLTGRGPS